MQDSYVFNSGHTSLRSMGNFGTFLQCFSLQWLMGLGSVP